MKRVTAVVLTHDAAIGRVEPGVVYAVDDEKAERWINNGIATEAAAAPPPPQPEPQLNLPEDDEDDDEGDADEEEKDPEELAAEAHKLHDEGLSERAIAGQMGISRTKVHSLLAA